MAEGLNDLRGASSWSDWPNHNPYAHLTEAELLDLREVKRERFQQVYDLYQSCFSEFNTVVKAIVLVQADSNVIQLDQYRHAEQPEPPEPPEPLAA